MQQTEWSPPAFGVAACGVLGLMMATAAVTLVTDAPGRVLTIIAAAGLILFAILSWRARPKLAMRDHGLIIRGPLRAHRGHTGRSGGPKPGRRLSLGPLDAHGD